MKSEQTHWVPARFRSLTDDEIGAIQHQLIDLKERAVEVAAEFKISTATVYRVKNAVPKELMQFDELALRRLRQRVKRRRVS